jgi:branched-chain amino acid transport system substrate-binding protein
VAGHPDAFVIIDFPDDYKKIVPFLLKRGSFDPAKTFTSDTMLVNNSVYQGIPAKAVEGVRGTQPATPTKGTAAQAFDRLYRGAAEAPAERQLFDAQNFDAVMLCFLASTAARTNNGQAIRDHLTAVSGPPGVKYTYLQLPQAVKALRAGKEIDYEGVSGPINFDDHGDPTVAPYRVFEYRGGKPHTLREFYARN